jgi:SagB-type dehydrogenase family enzyme
MYTTLEAQPLPTVFERSSTPALAAIAGATVSGGARLDRQMLARLCYFANGVTRVIRGMPFRAAACTGALYHIEVYVICAELDDLEAGVYHYGAHDNALRQLRQGDFRSATGRSRHDAEPVTLALTTTYWRNAWKYQSRAYRHAFWDSGTVLANLFAVSAANHLAAALRIGFVDRDLNALLDVDPALEATVALVDLAVPDADAAPSTDPPPLASPLGVETQLQARQESAIAPLGLVTQRLSRSEVDYPLIRQAHAASSIEVAWPERAPRLPDPPRLPVESDESIESVILRRGSSRRFTHDQISLDQLTTLLNVATRPINSDAPWPLTDPYLIVNAVDGLASGTYFFARHARALQPLDRGDFRDQAGFLAIFQALAADAAVNVYWLADLRTLVSQLGERAYRGAQIEAAIEAGKLYLAAYAQRLGATGLTFFDDDVVNFFSPHAAGKDVMFLAATGRPAAPSRARR